MSTSAEPVAVVEFPEPLSAELFLEVLGEHAERRLVFEYAGRRIQPGYHVTEVKSGTFASLDCGANPEHWSETVVQLWDVPGGEDAEHMSVAKFRSIYERVGTKVPLPGEAKLTFEAGDDASAAVHHDAARLWVEGDAVVVELRAQQTTCKPRDRWHERQGMDRPVLLAGPVDAPAARGCCA